MTANGRFLTFNKQSQKQLNLFRHKWINWGLEIDTRGRNVSVIGQRCSG